MRGQVHRPWARGSPAVSEALGTSSCEDLRDAEAAGTAAQAILTRSQAGLCKEELVPHLDAIVIHCQQPAALAGFYAEVLGLPVAPADVTAIEAGNAGPG